MSVEDVRAVDALHFVPRPRSGRSAAVVEPAPAAAQAWLPGHLALAALFSLTSFVGAALLFMVQPMVAKLILPLFGGSPSVWNTSNLFFQVTLLAGYIATHVAIRRLGVRRQSLLQLVLVVLPLLTLPIGLPGVAQPPEDVAAVVWLLYVLAMSVGAPFLLLSTTGPLLQRWFGATSHPRAQDPYFLFAAGNTGSLLALLSYPIVVEPRFAMDVQLRTWSWGYLAFALLIVAGVAAVRRQASPLVAQADEHVAVPALPVPRARRVRWVALAALPSSSMLGTTTFLTTDLTPVPLLWVVPLALYLVTFIVAFALRRATANSLARRLSLLIPVLVLAAAVPGGQFRLPILAQVALHLALFAVVATVAHARLAEDRPEVEQLTGFYVLVAVGGAVGGCVNGLLAPVLFEQFYEYPLALACAAFLVVRPRRDWSRLVRRSKWVAAAVAVPLLALLGLVVTGTSSARGWAAGAALLVAVLVLAVVGVRHRPVLAGTVALMTLLPLLLSDALVTSRTFFGVQQVRAHDDRHVLSHGSTVHGWQSTEPALRREPQTYYHRSGPAGQVFAAMPSSASTGVIGLGTGALAAYGRPGDRMTFFEIDQETVDIAREPRYFTYLQDSAATVDVVLGDGRLSMQRQPEASFDLLVLDAFSSDAIPVHLLTREAIGLYLSKLKADGRLLIHVSNRHVDLAPVLGNIAAEEAAHAVVQRYRPGDSTGGSGSEWVVLSRSRAALDGLAANNAWQQLGRTSNAPVWTDDFSNVFGALR